MVKDPFRWHRGAPLEVPVVDEVSPTVGDKEHGVAQSDPRPIDDADKTESDIDNIDEKAQPGVQKMEATTKVWTKSHLITAYVL